MRQNVRVYVKTPMFEGWATITDYFPNEEFYPIQDVLDEPDSDGQAIKRICKEHITEREEDESGQTK